MGARDDQKVTPGITELSRPRAHIERWDCDCFVEIQTFPTKLSNSSNVLEQIDGAACYIDVGSSYPGRAEVLRVKQASAQ